MNSVIQWLANELATGNEHNEAFYYTRPMPEELLFGVAKEHSLRYGSPISEELERLRATEQWELYEFPPRLNPFEFPVVRIKHTDLIGIVKETDNLYARVEWQDNDEACSAVINWDELLLMDVITNKHSEKR